MFMEKSKRYRLLLLIPFLLLVGSITLLFVNYNQTGEWFDRSIQLKGGTLITINTGAHISSDDAKNILSGFGDISVREISGFSGYGLLIEMEADADAEQAIQELENNGVIITASSIETMGPALGESFWAQAQTGIMIAFILMGIIVFAIFRTFVPSFAVMLAAASDIVVTLALMQVFGISLSLASLAAVLMLIGYSIDTDILLTSRLIRTREEALDKRMRNAFKTGITITGTTIGVMISLIFFGASIVLTQIAMVLLIGLGVDVVNTWLQNAVLLKWHCERKGIV
jgi:preprotein translocase subunit SecF